MDGEVDFGERLGVPPRLVASVALGTLLNPLNSSMIAVAVVTIQRHFEVGIATATWLLSGFYLSAAVGQPLMGRLVGGSLLIQGLIARLMYTSLYKMHQVSIHGLVRVVFDTLGRLLRERLEPRVKLH